MTSKVAKNNIVEDYRAARARLRLAPYDQWLVEHIAGRVARLLGKRDDGERGGAGQGDVVAAGGRAVSADSLARAHANNPPV